MFNEKEADCKGKKGILLEIAYMVDDDSPAFVVHVAPKGVGGSVSWPNPSDGMTLQQWYKFCCCCDGKPKQTFVVEETKLITRKSPDTRFSVRGLPNTGAPPNASPKKCLDLN